MGIRTDGAAALRIAGGLGAWSGALALSLSGFTLTTRLAPYSPVSTQVAYCTGFGLVVLSVLAVAIGAPQERRVCAGLAVSALLGLIVVQRVGPDAAGGLWVFCALLAFGSALGAWVGSAIERPGHLLFVALVSSLVDSFSVAHPDGPSAQLARQPEMLALLALPWPMLGTRVAVPLLGVGDVVFTSLYWSAARKHGLAWRRTLLALAGGYLVTLIAVLVAARPIPVLPMLGAGMLLAHSAARKPHARDLKQGLWLVTALAVALGVWVLRRAQ